MSGFLELHHRDVPLLLPNAWDAGSARILASMGFEAIATTSSGFAATLGRLDYQVTREEALAHGAALAAAVDVPVSADLEDGFGEDPATVAETVRLAADAGLAGCSVEDASRGTVLDFDAAVERVAAAAEAAGGRLVLTARAENHLHGRDDLADTIARLQAYERAGAHVLFAPGLGRIEDVRAVVEAVSAPVSVLAWPGLAGVEELASAGVRRISVGGAFAYASLAGLADAARELHERGTFGFLERAGAGSRALRRAVPPSTA